MFLIQTQFKKLEKPVTRVGMEIIWNNQSIKAVEQHQEDFHGKFVPGENLGSGLHKTEKKKQG